MDIKKYIVWGEPDGYEILELTEIERHNGYNGIINRYWTIDLYVYDGETLEEPKIYDVQYFTTDTDSDKELVLFTSDSLEECLEYHSISINLNKYNL